MKALRQLGFLKLNLRPAEVPLEEDHRVLALFRNRAELKKAYGDLQEETFRLKDLVKQQEGATQRVQEMLNTLEGRLGVADTAYPALVFYQLRHLWQTGRELVARRQSAEDELHAAHALQSEGHTQVAALEADRTQLTRLWHYFKRRALERRIGAARAALAGAEAAVAQAQAHMDEIAREAGS